MEGVGVLLYIIGGSVGWGFGKFVGVAVDREICDGVDIDVGNGVEICDSGQIIVLDVDRGVDDEFVRSIYGRVGSGNDEEIESEFTYKVDSEYGIIFN